MNITFPEYDFPCRLFDFNTEQEFKFESYRKLEKYVRDQLLSENIWEIKDGLSNVLYWGYIRIGYRDVRVNKFRDNITNFQLQAFKEISKTKCANPINIKKIGMSQFSGFSFISKILMFLDPTKNVVLDKKIMELRDPENDDNPLTNIPYSKGDSVIRISNVSQKFYFEWCKLCSFIAKQIDDDKIAVDIERGFFKLVEYGDIEYGRQIIFTEKKKLNALIGQ